ncbi:UBA-like domain-containing protein [Giardia muris]|uniref:UBA-like domain-containing protein n=1 Tax=Giardia muris TaxID=5742 RepID=A0A4Z1SQQ6_GIAMU|nr:UBA-like domain-containing protein [Giardia muris]|eukprot:TNJ28020.1 UBA-like domain-containing protein [Giardia muris]
MSGVEQFCTVTGCGKSQARQFLEMAGNDVNQAIMLFFDSGVEPIPDFPSSSSKEPTKPTSHRPQHPVEKKPPPPQRTERPGPSKSEQPPPKSVPAPQPTRASATKAGPKPAQGKFSTMADYLSNSSDSDRPENDYYAGSGQKIRAQPNTIAAVNAAEAARESGCKVTIDFYDDGFLLNGHKPFFPFSNAKSNALLEEMRTAQTIPSDILNALHPEERPKQGQPIYTQIRTHAEKFDDSKLDSASSGGKKSYSFEAGEKKRSLGSASASTSVPAPTTTNTRGTTGGPSTSATGSGTPTLKLIPGKPTAPVRVKADKTYTMETNPDIHTIRDLLAAIHSAGGDIPTASECHVKVLSTGKLLTDISLTVGAAGIERQQVLVVRK